MNNLFNWFNNLFRRKYNFKVCEDFQENIDNNTIYFVGNKSHFDFLQMECPCGCKEQIKLSLIKFDKPNWQVKFNDNRISISPSIWRTKGCRSHFFVKDNKIIWAKNKSHFSFKKIIYKFFVGGNNVKVKRKY